VLAASAFQLARRLSLLDFECLLFGFAIFGVNDNKLSCYCQGLFVTSLQVLLQPWQLTNLHLSAQP